MKNSDRLYPLPRARGSGTSSPAHLAPGITRDRRMTMKKTMKKAVTTTKPLALRRQTLRDLIPEDLVHAAGGGSDRCQGTNLCTVPTTSSTCPM
jgi:hypothetical protein